MIICRCRGVLFCVLKSGERDGEVWEFDTDIGEIWKRGLGSRHLDLEFGSFSNEN